jgi:hypothetical protein
VAAYDFADGGGVGWGGLEDGGDLGEVVGAEEARGDDGEGLCRGGVEVFEAVDDSARDEDGVAGAGPPLCLAVDGVRKNALEAAGGLFTGVARSPGLGNLQIIVRSVQLRRDKTIAAPTPYWTVKVSAVET